MPKQMTIEEAKIKLTESVPHFEIISDVYVNSHTILKCKCNIHETYFERDLSHLTRGQGCDACSEEKIKNNNPKKLNLEKVKTKIYDINKNIEIISDEYINSITPLKFRCLLDGHKWETSYTAIVENNKKSQIDSGCPMCAGQVLTLEKSFAHNKPEYMKYLKNKEDGYNNFTFSSNKIDLICPDCGVERKDFIISELSNRGFICRRCGDNDSFPSKMVANALTALGFDYKTDTTTYWSENKRYDFIIESINTIIEVHGAQHYNEVSLTKRTLKEEQENDKYKELLAYKNGINQYMVVNAINTNHNKMIKAIQDSFNGIFDLTDINWNEIIIDSYQSKVPKSWDLYNDGFNQYQISEKLNVHFSTVYKYLKIGKSLGRIDKIINRHSKKILQYDLDMNLVKEYDSIREASNFFNVDESTISKALRGITKQTQGYKWKYKE